MTVLDREHLGMGEEVQQFEQELTEFFGRPAVCVVNGTAALHLACQTVGLGSGDEVLVQSLTYLASFQAISATGATPVPCDIEPATLTLNWRDAEKRLTPRTKAVMPVHYASGVGDIDGIYEFAGRHGLRVIEDAAHAFGTRHGGIPVGGFGDIACFSFDGIKNITAGEGGCVVTEDQDVCRQAREARLLGVEPGAERLSSGERSWTFDVSNQGWRYHMSNIMAAIGLAQLERFSTLAATRQALARHYDSLLADRPRIHPIQRKCDGIVPHIYVVRVAGLMDRDSLRDDLLKRGIETGVHYMPNHRLSRYHVSSGRPLPATEAVYPELITLPLHPDLNDTDIQHVCDTLCGLVQ
jgi:dTDP-4-amino-4,6-dideoxygalactose transaminase